MSVSVTQRISANNDLEHFVARATFPGNMKALIFAPKSPTGLCLNGGPALGAETIADLVRVETPYPGGTHELAWC